MQIFKTKPDGFKEVKKRMLFRAIPFALIVLVGAIAIGLFNPNNNNADISELLIMIPIIGLAVGFGLYSGLMRQKTLFNSYTITITNNLITREQLNTPPVSIYFSTVKEIAKYKNGSFIIRGQDSGDLIVVPAQIDNYVELENVLRSIKPITVNDNRSFLEKYRSVTGLLTGGLFLCVYIVNHKLTVAIAGTIFIAIMIWSLKNIHKSKNIDRKTKNGIWWGLLVIVSVMAMMFVKLTG